MNSLENTEGPKQVTSSLSASSKAIPLVAGQENMSEFLRSMLEDFATANGCPTGYASIPEAERLKKFFRVRPPRQQVRQSIQAYISKMEGNRKFLLYTVKYVSLWKKYSRLFLKDYFFMYLIFRFIVGNVNNLMKNGVPKDGVEYAFISDIQTFAGQCSDTPAPDVVGLMEGQEDATEKAVQMFILLVYQWFCLSDAMPKTKEYPAEKVADTALEFMKLYMSRDYWNDMLLPTFFYILRRKQARREGNPCTYSVTCNLTKDRCLRPGPRQGAEPYDNGPKINIACYNKLFMGAQTAAGIRRHRIISGTVLYCLGIIVQTIP